MRVRVCEYVGTHVSMYLCEHVHACVCVCVCVRMCVCVLCVRVCMCERKRVFTYVERETMYGREGRDTHNAKGMRTQTKYQSL